MLACRHDRALLKVIDRDVQVLRAVDQHHVRYRVVLSMRNAGTIDELHDAPDRLRRAGFLSGGEGRRPISVTREGRAALCRLEDQAIRRRLLVELLYGDGQAT